MEKKDVFAILPYLKTTGRVPIRGILFRSSDDLEGLSTEQQGHLRTLFAMFFLQNDYRIKRMTYALFPVSEDRKAYQDIFRRLYEAQTLINYEYAAPQPPREDPFLSREHASMYVFTAEKVYCGLIWPYDPNIDYNVENVTGEKHPHNQDIEGYYGVLNSNMPCWVTGGNRIYPPVPHLTLNIPQDLWRDIAESIQVERHWAWRDVLEGYTYTNAELQKRLFSAMEWYNRSTAQDVDEAEVLLNLAVAFECLLNLENNDKITTRFRETVMTLLGSVPRLDSWLEQFYDARSSVVHKGIAQNIMFLAKEWERNRGKDTKALHYRSLTAYGRRIFRLCLTAILTSARVADDEGLAEFFVHNQERLETIIQQLSETAEPPEERLNSIAAAVAELHDHHWASQELVQSKTLVTVGKLVVKTYLETKPQLSNEDEAAVQEVLQQLDARDIEADNKLELFKRMIAVLDHGEDITVTEQPLAGVSLPGIILLSLLKYVTSPHFLTRKWIRRPQFNGQTAPS